MTISTKDERLEVLLEVEKKVDLKESACCDKKGGGVWIMTINCIGINPPIWMKNF